MGRCILQIREAHANNFNFDHPRAFDEHLMLDTLVALHRREPVHIPIYDYSTHSRRAETVLMQPADVILFEGILVLNWPEIRQQLDMKLFVDVDSDVRLSRRGKGRRHCVSG